MDGECVSHQAVSLDCVILLSNSINRARADLDVAAYKRIVILPVRHRRISVMVTEERVDSYARLTRLKARRNAAGGQGTPVTARINWSISD